MRGFVTFILFSGLILLSSPGLASEEEDFYTAQKAFSEGFYDASLKLFENFIKNYPRSVNREQAELFIGKSLYYEKNFEGASKVFLRLVQEGSSEAVISEAIYWLGELNFQAKKYKQASDFFNRLIKEYPESKFFFWAKYSLGFSFLMQEDLTLAEKTFEEILTDCRDEEVRTKTFFALAKVYYNFKNYLRLKELVLRWIKEQPQIFPKDYVYYYLGEAEYAFKNYSQAIDYYKQAMVNLNDFSLRDDILQSLGWSFLEREDFSEAEKYFSQIESPELKTYSLGSFYYKSKQYQKAYDYFNKLIENYPQSSFLVRASLGMADSLYNLGRFNDAISLYQSLVKRENLDREILEEIYYNLGWCYLKIADYKKAIEIFGKLSSASGEIVKMSAQINIADVYQEAGQFKEAIETYNKILGDFPGNIYSDYIQFQIGLCFLKENDFEASIISFENFLKNFPSSSFVPEVRYYLALAQSALNNFDASIRILQDLLREKLKNKELLKEVYLLLLQNYIDKKDYSSASKLLGEIPQTLSDNPEFIERVEIQKALFYADQDRYDLAKKILDDFLKKFPGSSLRDKVLLYLGDLYYKERDYSRAKSYYERLNKEYPRSRYLAEARINLAQILYSEGKIEEAEKLLTLNLDSKEMSLQSQILLSDFKLSQGDFESALKICDALLSEDSSPKGFLYFKKARIYQERGDYPEAYENFLKAREAGFDSAELRFSSGFCLEKMGKFEEAIKSFFELIYIFPQEEEAVKAYLRIAKLYEKSGNIKEAKKVYQKLAEMKVEEAKYAQEKLKELAEPQE